MENTETIQPEPRVLRRKKDSFLSKHWKKIALILVIIVVIIGSGAGGYFFRGFISKGEDSNTTGQVAGVLKELPKVVAYVNSEEIKREDFQKRVELSSQSYTSQGVDVTGEQAQTQIRENVIQNMVNEKIILQYSSRDGITVSDEDLNQKLADFIEQLGGQDKFVEAIKVQNLTEEYVKEDIKRQSIVQEYLNQKVVIDDIEVADEEVETSYNTLLETVEKPEEAPSLEDSFENIKSQLLQQKIQARTNEFVDSLRQESTIQIMF